MYTFPVLSLSLSIVSIIEKASFFPVTWAALLDMGCKTCEKPKANYRKGLWSPEEDQRLRDYILRYGHGCWSSVPAKAGELLHFRFRSTLNSDDYGTKLASENWKRHKCMISMSAFHMSYIWPICCAPSTWSYIYICLIEHLSFLRLRLAVCPYVDFAYKLKDQIEKKEGREWSELCLYKLQLWINCLVTAAGLQRNGKSCRLRWINYLRPGLKRGMLSQAEEETVINLHAAWGNKYASFVEPVLLLYQIVYWRLNQQPILNI